MELRQLLEISLLGRRSCTYTAVDHSKETFVESLGHRTEDVYDAGLSALVITCMAACYHQQPAVYPSVAVLCGSCTTEMEIRAKESHHTSDSVKICFSFF